MHAESCDKESGRCKCLPGYRGELCDKGTVHVDYVECWGCLYLSPKQEEGGIVLCLTTVDSVL